MEMQLRGQEGNRFELKILSPKPILFTAPQRFGPCIHCNWCRFKGVHGKYCAFQDDLKPLSPMFLKADAILNLPYSTSYVPVENRGEGESPARRESIFGLT